MYARNNTTGRAFYAETTTGVAVTAYAVTGGLLMEGRGFTGPKFHITSDGTYVTGSDFAESMPARGDIAGYAPGDVLVLDADVPGGVAKASRAYNTRVAGIYSTRPGSSGADKGGTLRASMPVNFPW